MATTVIQSFSLAALCGLAAAAPAPLVNKAIRALDAYAPVTTSCPSESLVRPATSINTDEAAYVSARKINADSALASWLAKQGSFDTSSQPMVGFTSSGGGYRSLLETAGVVQGLDARDSNINTSGLYQALTYEAGLSGGSWFLSSLAGNNWPTVTYLKDNLWLDAFQNSALLPANIFSISDDLMYAEIDADLQAKSDAGYNITIVDPYGRLLSHQLLEGFDGGVSTRLSGLTAFSNFTAHAVPFPIITTTSTDLGMEGQCFPELNSPIFEFSPYEYGSWDEGVSAFAVTEYMGTAMSNGAPSTAGQCTVYYDNLGYIFGTSSDVWNAVCEIIEPSSSSSADLEEALEYFVSNIHAPVFQDLFGVYPNPFYNYTRSNLVSENSLLTLADGGETNQNNPIWPFIQPERSVDVLIVNDNSADTSTNYPNGSEIYQTYVRAQATGLTKMPYIPDVATFISEGLNQHATFFGCNETDTIFIVWLPNVDYTYDSGQSTSKVEYTKSETEAMIANGVQIANQNGEEGWSFCLACAIKNGDGNSLPDGCNECFSKYCYYKSGTSD
ncbi:MAG: hypothetical protein FE78DRAFT_27805 [Acidomyces sp. 'richmondensis']|nr:MAG: hypothetical protein FE78DRAFT_27805 [Acidomyces sp. 'richmondensis']